MSSWTKLDAKSMLEEPAEPNKLYTWSRTRVTGETDVPGLPQIVPRLGFDKHQMPTLPLGHLGEDVHLRADEAVRGCIIADRNSYRVSLYF